MTITTTTTKKIEISYSVSPDSMGDWGEMPQGQVAEEFAKFLTGKWAAQAAQIPELDGFGLVVDVDVQQNIGDSFAGVEVDTGDTEEEFRLAHELAEEFDSNQYWEEFCCESPFAAPVDMS